MIHNSGQAKVAYLDVAIPVQEDVSGLQVSVQDFLRGLPRGVGVRVVSELVVELPPVALVKAKRDLHQYFPNDILSNMV